MKYGLWMFLGVPFGGIPLLYVVFSWYGKVSSAGGNPYVFLPGMGVLILIALGLWVCFGLALMGLSLLLVGFARHFCWVTPPVTAQKSPARRYVAGANWSPSLVSIGSGVDAEETAPAPLKIFLLLDRKREGPFDYETLVDRLYAGKLSPTILGCEQNTETWVPVKDLLVTAGFKCDVCGSMPVHKANALCKLCEKTVKAKPVAITMKPPLKPAAVLVPAGAKSGK